MSTSDLTGLNTGYVAQLLEDYLDAPASVAPEWRELFERDPASAVASLPGLARLLKGNGNGSAGSAPPALLPVAPALAPIPSAPDPPASPVVQPASPAPEQAALAEGAADEVAAADGAPARLPVAVEPDEILLGGVAAAMALVKAYRMHGHLAARLDPLGSEPMGDPALDESRLVPSLTPELQARIPASLLRLYVPGETLLEALPRLREVYTGLDRLRDRAHLRPRRAGVAAAGDRVGTLPPAARAEERIALLRRLSQAEGFEQYLRRVVPRPEAVLARRARRRSCRCSTRRSSSRRGGAHEVVIGMAHRGRLNALRTRVGRSYESILREFEGERTIDALVADPEGGTGDVKYHLAASGTRMTAAGEIEVTIVPEPEPPRGRRSRSSRGARAPSRPTARAAPACTIRRSRCRCSSTATPRSRARVSSPRRSTCSPRRLLDRRHAAPDHQQPGRLHDRSRPRAARRATRATSRRASTCRSCTSMPTTPRPRSSAIRLALAYRAEFGHDFVVDLVGYRRFGHNEQDDASYTQPLMVERIEHQPTVRELYAARLVRDGVLTGEQAGRIVAEVTQTLRAAHERLRTAIGRARRLAECPGGAAVRRQHGRRGRHGRRRRPARDADEQLLAVPDGFTVNAEAREAARAPPRRRSRRRHRLGTGGGARATRRCSRRESRSASPARTPSAARSRTAISCSTTRTRARRTRRSSISPARNASFEIYNSPLSEYAALGFEYGYSVAAPDALVLWEAQFGDFVNGAQIVVDQFLVAGRSKWGQTSRLTLLLPHGYEGNGPEHSSARLERFLQLRAQDNIRVANCTTAAQFFHLLRRQALDATARPLVVMTPKGLLRLRAGVRDASRARRAARSSRSSTIPAADHDDGAPPRALQRQGLLRHRRARGAADAADGRRRTARAAVPVPGRGGRGAHRLVPALAGDRVGAGGAAEHGRLALDPPPARRRRRRVGVPGSPTSAGRGAPARARAIRPRTS